MGFSVFGSTERSDASGFGYIPAIASMAELQTHFVFVGLDIVGSAERQTNAEDVAGRRGLGRVWNGTAVRLTICRLTAFVSLTN